MMTIVWRDNAGQCGALTIRCGLGAFVALVVASCTSPGHHPPANRTSTQTSIPRSTPTPGGAGSAGLVCGTGYEHPSGAPFCYAIPTGYTDDSKASGYGSGWDYRSLVWDDKSNTIQVIESRLPQAINSMSASVRHEWFTGQMLVPGHYGVKSATVLTPVVVDGASGYTQQVTMQDESQFLSITVARGTSFVNIRCLAPVKLAIPVAACRTVLHSIKIVSD